MTTCSSRHRVLALAVGLLIAATSAYAETPREREARKHFEAGATAYRLGNFSSALEEYRLSYALFPSPLLLYDMALAEQKLGNKTGALHHFKQVVGDPNLDRALEANARSAIAEIEADLARSEGEENERRKAAIPIPAPSSSIEAVHKTPSKALAVFTIAAASVGVVLLGTSVGLLVDARSLDGTVPGETLEQANHRASRKWNEQAAGATLVAIGGVALISSLVGAVLWHRAKSATPRVAFWMPTESSAGLCFGGSL